ncbi:Eukaryotic translation initiation factor 4 gamma 3 [Halotydeus destructor]|nr:Eukaryotic translation initiation factor 4 gamma 3 [Halotydeus destructor]
MLPTIDTLWKFGNWSTENPEDIKTVKLLQRLLGILNRITYDNFEVLLDQAKHLEIDSDERLKYTVELVFEKAIDEPVFSEHYARLCDKLKHVSVTLQSESFERLLLKRCESELERSVYSNIDVETRRSLIASCNDRQRRRQMIVQLDDDMRQCRRRFKGLISFVGELYKARLVEIQLIMSCVHRMMSDKSEENIEMFCTLARKIGLRIQNELSNLGVVEQEWTPYFIRLNEFVQDGNLSDRIRFLVMETIEVRNRGWTERRTREE